MIIKVVFLESEEHFGLKNCSPAIKSVGLLTKAQR